MPKLDELKQKLEGLNNDIKALIDKDDYTLEDQKKVEELQADYDKIAAQMESLEKAVKLESKVQETIQKLQTPPVQKPKAESTLQWNRTDMPIRYAAVPRTPLRNLKGPNACETAYAFGQWIAATLRHPRAMQWCQEHGYPLNWTMEAQSGSNNALGGYLVPEQFATEILKLRDEYGIFRRNTRVINITVGDTFNMPIETQALEAFPVGEGQAITESSKEWKNVSLIARKWGVIGRFSTELSEDALVNLADDLAGDIARAFAYKEDICGFSGTGTSTCNGIIGVCQKLKTAAGNPTTTSAGGVVIGSGNLMSELTLADHNHVMARLPQYARSGAKWYCSPYYFDAVMSRLAYAAGGNTVSSILGGTTPTFFGYPVELVPAGLPTTDANSQIVCLFGRLDLASVLGDKRSITLAYSNSAVVNGVSTFECDQIAYRATTRFDIAVHSVGSTTEAGPIVGLQTLNA